MWTIKEQPEFKLVFVHFCSLPFCRHVIHVWRKTWLVCVIWCLVMIGIQTLNGQIKKEKKGMGTKRSLPTLDIVIKISKLSFCQEFMRHITLQCHMQYQWQCQYVSSLLVWHFHVKWRNGLALFCKPKKIHLRMFLIRHKPILGNQGLHWYYVCYSRLAVPFNLKYYNNIWHVFSESKNCRMCCLCVL